LDARARGFLNEVGHHASPLGYRCECRRHGPQPAAGRTLSGSMERHKRAGESSSRTHKKPCIPNGLSVETAPHPYGEPAGFCGVLWRLFAGLTSAHPPL
jgi:hypothetical protein